MSEKVAIAELKETPIVSTSKPRKRRRDFDLFEKLADYKQIPSLQQVIFLEQNRLWASTYIRKGTHE
jgi:hypothetical protein